MWTIILTFLKNPKNLIIVILAILVLTCGTVVLFQRGSIAKASAKVALQSAEIERYKAVQKAYIDLIDDYTTQIVKLQKLAESHQAITNQTAKQNIKIKYIKSKCALEGEDAKIVNGVVEYFNSGRMRE
jgi:uncharacterized membrane protein YGL010W